MSGRRRSLLTLGLFASVMLPIRPVAGSETVTYSYDVSGQLVKVARTGTVNDGLNACYSYDKVDNRSNVTTGISTVCASAPPGFLVSDAQAAPGASATFTVTRRGNTSGIDTISYATSDMTAVAVSDYTATSGTLTFAAGEVSKTISVPTVADAPRGTEVGEKFLLTLSNASGSANLIDAQGIGIIEAAPSISIGNAAAAEGATMTFTVYRDKGFLEGSHSVSFNTSANTAAAGGDYITTNGVVKFTGWETTKTITVSTINDVADEAITENFFVNISGPGVPFFTKGEGKIVDDEGAGLAVWVEDTTTNEGAPAVFTIRKIGAGPVTITYIPVNGTASVGMPPNCINWCTVTFSGGSINAAIPTIRFSGPQLDKYFYLNVSGPAGTVVDSQGIGTVGDGG